MVSSFASQLGKTSSKVLEKGPVECCSGKNAYLYLIQAMRVVIKMNKIQTVCPRLTAACPQCVSGS